ncbi:MAG TPA: AMP-binding protein [Chitinispirillaceae bacterium]|nr:AMP-binding protein [Chitinispirillaceae bacterium]
MNFRPELSWEFLSTDEIGAKTVRALRNHVKHLKEISDYYRDSLWDVSPDDIESIEDFQRLKFTQKQTVTENLSRFIAVESPQISETVLTSGSTGNPLIFPLTSNDLDRLAFNEALSFHGAGVDCDDSVQVMLNLDRLSVGGMAYYRGLTLLGCNTMRTGVLLLEAHRYYLDLLKPTVAVVMPSFLKKLALDLQKNRFDSANSSLKKIICVGESIRNKDMELNSVGKSLQELWGAEVYSSYSSTEISVSYCECQALQGGHAHPELVYTEIIDEQGNVLPDGEPGELVATPLGVEGLPLLRYRTGDITFKMTKPCSCGRNSLRIGPILGRASQLIRLKGATVYPLAITNALDELDEVNDYVLVIESDNSSSDRVAIHVATSPVAVEKIANHLRAVARVNFPILVSNLPTIQSMRGGASRKKIRILDWRTKNSALTV